ncbi:MAG: hypothetical protein AAB823_01725 [Patescibacteria group bacterium]
MINGVSLLLALFSFLLMLIVRISQEHRYIKKEDLIDTLKKINKNLTGNCLIVALFLLIIGLTTTIFTLKISESFSTFFSFASGWQLALGNILLSLSVGISLPIYFFLKWNSLRKVEVDYSRANNYLASLKDGEMVLLSKLIDQAKSLGLLVIVQGPRLFIGLISWVVVLLAVNYLNVTIAMRLLKGYSWGPIPAQTQQKQPQKQTEISRAGVISTSPSGKYWLRFGQRSGVYDPLELVTPVRPLPLMVGSSPVLTKEYLGTKESYLSDKIRFDFDKNNIVWNDDESAFAITYIYNIDKEKDGNKTSLTTARLAIFSTASGDLVKSIDLDGSYYGNNVQRAFYPVVSSNGKYIAVATDLIRQISIFDFMGNKIKDLQTKYSNVELFSPEMYELEGGKYSPFLDYKWSEDGKAILYRFEGTEKYFEVKFQ